jgi:hypothetical protein
MGQEVSGRIIGRPEKEEAMSDKEGFARMVRELEETDLDNWSKGWAQRDMWTNYELMRCAMELLCYEQTVLKTVREAKWFCADCGKSDIRFRTRGAGDMTCKEALE